MSTPGPGSSRIRRLDEATANQIAAGEVVERPASVVKELVENALDAEATRIRVDVEEGGTRRIRITDDGIGMSPQDAELCLQRHATSKIRSVEDLDVVRTLGFRGEAVPSIASVSRFVLTTREPQAASGTRVVVEGGRTVQVAEVGAPVGTTIDVKDLFYNVPARKKFLKRAQTELAHISEGLVRLAMCRPQVGFRLATESKVLLDVPPGTDGDAKGRLARILSPKVAEGLHAVVDDGRSHAVQVTGFAAEPGVSERGTKGLYTFVNGRFVRDRTIVHAVQDAYRTLLERGRYPIVVLFIEVDPSTYDVNVHPQKTEVRFARTGDIHRAVTGALSRTLSTQPWLRGAEAPPAPKTYKLDGGDGFFEHAARAAKAHGASPSFGAAAGRYVPRRDLSSALGGASAAREPSGLDGSPRGPVHPAGPIAGAVASAQLQAAWSGRFSELQPVGQVLGTYLVCQAPGRMVIIDQHAAHERVVFQRLRTQKKQDALRVQPLLVPLRMDLDPRRAELAHDVRDRLAAIGFEIEPLQGATWQVKSCPAALADARLEQLVNDLLDELEEQPRATGVDESLDALFSCAACHGSVRARDRLSNPEIEALLAQMDEIDFGAFCPHGRPVFVEWSEGELGKLFHRS